jgi:SPOR domain
MRRTKTAALALFALVLLPQGRFALVGSAAAEPSWVSQVAGSFSEAQAMNDYHALADKFPNVFSAKDPVVMRGVMAGGGTGNFYNVLIPAPTRDDAQAFCDRLEAAGGACVVVKTELPQ